MVFRWPEFSIRDVAEPVDRSIPPIIGTMYRQVGVRLWGGGVYEREALEGGNTNYRALNCTRTGDIIVNKIWARNGSVSIVPEHLNGCYVSNEFPLFRPDPLRLSSEWFYWITKCPWFWNRCDSQARGSSGKNRIRPEKFLEIQIPLPPLSEQRRIVEKIERLAGKIEEAQRLRRSNIETATNLAVRERASAMGKTFQSGSTALCEAATLERGKFAYRPRNDPRFFGGNHPWIQIGEIEAANKYIRRWTQTLNDEGLAISRKFPRGTLLISIAATIGSVGILDFDCCVPDSIVAVTPKRDVESEFVYHYLGYLRTYLQEPAPQSAQKNINLRILADLPFPKITVTQQRRIVEYLDSLQSKVELLKKMQAQTAAELDALLPSILDKAFRGEL